MENLNINIKVKRNESFMNILKKRLQMNQENYLSYSSPYEILNRDAWFLQEKSLRQYFGNILTNIPDVTFLNYLTRIQQKY